MGISGVRVDEGLQMLAPWIKGGVDAEDAPCRSTGLLVVLVWVNPAFDGRQGLYAVRSWNFQKPHHPPLSGKSRG
ncbi:MAG: hypothetical protein EBR40_08635 [Proteobacteria bacterium]|nr:hypothetical protein [Pseudomonadota bacterium]